MDLSTIDILCYHKVHRKDDSSPGFPEDKLSLDDKEFEKHLIYLKENYNILNLKSNNEENEIHKRKLLITFDDGTKDILEVVLPIIEKYDIPIIIFITTSLVENNSTSCWFIDLWENISSRSRLIIKIGTKIKCFNTETLTDKYNCYREIHKVLFAMRKEEQIEFFRNNNLNSSYNKYFLNKRDVIKLATHPLVTLGYHSHYHLNYRIESLDTIKDDIDKMLYFFKVNKIEPSYKMFAFCYGKSSQEFLESPSADCFDLYFTLGFKSMFLNKKMSVIPRIDVSNKTLSQLKVKLILSRVFRFFSKIFKDRLVK